MTPIDGLLRKAGELNDAGMKELSPALEAMAAVQASMADTLSPFFEVLADLRAAEPFSYGFVIPAEPPEIKADLGETFRNPDRAEVVLGPINVNAITKEIQKALENVGRDSVDVRAIYSSFTGPAALPSVVARQPESREVRVPPQAALPGNREQAPAQIMPPATQAQPADERHDRQAMAKPQAPGHWAEQSIRRSNIVMSDLNEVRRNITEKTITAEKVREISTEALAIGATVATTGARPVLPESPAIREETPRAPYSPAERPGASSPPVGRVQEKPPARVYSSDEWVEQSIRRSNIVMSDLNEVRRNITEKTITAEKVREISTEALAIGATVTTGGRQTLPETPAIHEEPSMAPFTYTPPMAPERRNTGTAPAAPERARAAGPIPGKTPQSGPMSGEAPPRKYVEAPPIRLRPKIVAPAEEAEFNARRLSGARSASTESVKPSALPGEAKSGSVESPVRIEWPVVRQPEGRESRASDVQQHNSIRNVSAGSSPVTEVIRSFGAMGDYVRAVSEIGGMAGNSGGAVVVPPGMGAGTSIINAMAGISAIQHPASAPPGTEIQNVISRPYPASPAAAYPDTAGAGGIPAGIVSAGAGAGVSRMQAMPGVNAARVMMPAMGIAAGIAAARDSQRSGASMIRHLLQAAPHVTGNVAPQVSAIYDSGRGLPFAAPVSPAAASGAENIVNVSVPPGGRGSVNESNTTNKVSSFHNTFNITVNVKSGDERDLKDLGKKIGQILSEEMKRYGGI